MKDIQEIAKTITREEFIEKQSQQVYKPSCPHRFKLESYFPKCSSKIFDCEECWENAVKNITFKGEEMTAIWINDKTDRNNKIKILGLTEGNEYPVKQSIYPNHYELKNDLGEITTYFMDRFKIVEE